MRHIPSIRVTDGPSVCWFERILLLLNRQPYKNCWYPLQLQEHWTRKINPPPPRRLPLPCVSFCSDNEDNSTPPEMQRTGPMVAVYLDHASVEKLTKEYPGTNPGRLRKVVVQYNPSEDERGLYETHYGSLATIKVFWYFAHAYGTYLCAALGTVCCFRSLVFCVNNAKLSQQSQCQWRRETK